MKKKNKRKKRKKRKKNNGMMAIKGEGKNEIKKFLYTKVSLILICICSLIKLVNDFILIGRQYSFTHIF
jgi:hypothetical protein